MSHVAHCLPEKVCPEEWPSHVPENKDLKRTETMVIDKRNAVG